MTSEGLKGIGQLYEHVIRMPQSYPMLWIILLQLFAYRIAVLSGCDVDVDQPRNLAEAATVE